MAAVASLDGVVTILPDLLRGAPAEREVLRSVTGRLTYGDLERRSDRVAAALLAEGLRPGDRVAYHGSNGPELFDLLFGAAKAGVCTVLVNARFTDTEVAGVLADARPRLLIGGSPGPGAVPLNGGGFERWVRQAQGPVPRHRPVDRDVAVQLYTSGTGGSPKGVRFTHGALTRRTLDIARHWGMTASDVSLLSMPLTHIGGLQWSLTMIATGGRGVVVQDTAPEALLDVLECGGITTGFLVPAVLDAMAALPGAGERDLDAVRAIGYGASTILPAVLRRIRGCFAFPLFQCYGMTETGGVVTQLDPSEHTPGNESLDTAGRAYPWVEMQVVDPDTEECLPAGAVGELRVRTDTAMLGYWGRPEESATAFDRYGMLRTGDLARIDRSGYLRLTGRLSDLIITGGENVSPDEVEAVLAEHPRVAEVAVVGVPDARWGERVVAAVVWRDEAPDPDGVTAAARERLASFKVPRTVVGVDRLPRNGTGKLLRRTLSETLAGSA